MPRKSLWYDSDNPAVFVRGTTWRGMIWVIAVVVFFGLLGAGIWAFNVFTSPVKGAGDVYQKNNSADNRIAAQSRLRDMYAAVLTEDAQLDQAAADVKAHPSDSFYSSTFTGIQQECIRDSNQYNSEAGKMMLKDWLTPDLPSKIDPTDPKTDCKPTSTPTPTTAP